MITDGDDYDASGKSMLMAHVDSVVIAYDFDVNDWSNQHAVVHAEFKKAKAMVLLLDLLDCVCLSSSFLINWRSWCQTTILCSIHLLKQ